MYFIVFKSQSLSICLFFDPQTTGWVMSNVGMRRPRPIAMVASRPEIRMVTGRKRVTQVMERKSVLSFLQPANVRRQQGMDGLISDGLTYDL
jgi:hypothetical protein